MLYVGELNGMGIMSQLICLNRRKAVAGNRGREGGRKEGYKKEAKRKWEKGEGEREVLAAQEEE